MMKSGVSRRSSLTDARTRTCTSAVAQRFYEACEICLRYEIYWGICVPKTIEIELGLTKLLQK